MALASPARFFACASNVDMNSGESVETLMMTSHSSRGFSSSLASLMAPSKSFASMSNTRTASSYDPSLLSKNTRSKTSDSTPASTPAHRPTSYDALFFKNPINDDGENSRCKSNSMS